MAWTLIRIDFTETCECIFGEKKHYITCGKGYVVVNNEGIEAFCGPQCAKNSKYVTNPNEKVPDFTKGCLVIDVKEQTQSTFNPHSDDKSPSQINNQKSDYIKAISYLLLRVEKLKHYPQMRYKKLSDIYGKYLSGQLDNIDINFLLMLGESSIYPEFSYQNLQAIYACDFWINQFLKQNANKDTSFVKEIKSYLVANLALTPSQIKGLNRWFDNTEGKKIVNIKPNAFAIDPTTYWKNKFKK